MANFTPIVARNSTSAASFSRARLVMGAVDELLAVLLERLGRRHIGEDHELLDQAVRLQPLRDHDAVEGAVWLEQDLALGQVEIERRAALRACLATS